MASYKDRRKSPCEDEKDSFRIYFEPVHSCLCPRAVFTCAGTEKHSSRKRAIFFSAETIAVSGKLFRGLALRGFYFVLSKGVVSLVVEGTIV